MTRGRQKPLTAEDAEKFRGERRENPKEQGTRNRENALVPFSAISAAVLSDLGG
jgi:hypothetical protein